MPLKDGMSPSPAHDAEADKQESASAFAASTQLDAVSTASGAAPPSHPSLRPPLARDHGSGSITHGDSYRSFVDDRQSMIELIQQQTHLHSLVHQRELLKRAAKRRNLTSLEQHTLTDISRTLHHMHDVQTALDQTASGSAPRGLGFHVDASGSREVRPSQIPLDANQLRVVQAMLGGLGLQQVLPSSEPPGQSTPKQFDDALDSNASDTSNEQIRSKAPSEAQRRLKKAKKAKYKARKKERKKASKDRPDPVVDRIVTSSPLHDDERPQTAIKEDEELSSTIASESCIPQRAHPQLVDTLPDVDKNPAQVSSPAVHFYSPKSGLRGAWSAPASPALSAADSFVASDADICEVLMHANSPSLSKRGISESLARRGLALSNSTRTQALRTDILARHKREASAFAGLEPTTILSISSSAKLALKATQAPSSSDSSESRATLHHQTSSIYDKPFGQSYSGAQKSINAAGHDAQDHRSLTGGQGSRMQHFDSPEVSEDSESRCVQLNTVIVEDRKKPNGPSASRTLARGGKRQGPTPFAVDEGSESDSSEYAASLPLPDLIYGDAALPAMPTMEEWPESLREQGYEPIYQPYMHIADQMDVRRCAEASRDGAAQVFKAGSNMVTCYCRALAASLLFVVKNDVGDMQLVGCKKSGNGGGSGDHDDSASLGGQYSDSELSESSSLSDQDPLESRTGIPRADSEYTLARTTPGNSPTAVRSKGAKHVLEQYLQKRRRDSSQSVSSQQDFPPKGTSGAATIVSAETTAAMMRTSSGMASLDLSGTAGRRLQPAAGEGLSKHAPLARAHRAARVFAGQRRLIIRSNRPSRGPTSHAAHSTAQVQHRVAEVAPLRLHSGPEHGGLPRPKVARNLLSRQTRPRLVGPLAEDDRLRLLFRASSQSSGEGILVQTENTTSS
ncbi:hypothetical protein IE81DRAFT_171937 [Ceraceosorus guamensis]|uniref:Uncharacterized protein n=1 Tax=Ceraceosorus guamensis TaxID=1522189 RepID=A0A316VVA7_9BASI|nr:hypothetical protein IE81DRAFT_171937 [Ceraceosorus guamensis]PWN41567.1 hypothetical protein IE81DRAFT_171937 [Ceraceosorus guamensis]